MRKIHLLFFALVILLILTGNSALATSRARGGGSPTPTPTPTPVPIADNAVCISISAPDRIIAGQKFTASVTVKNTGTTIWTSPAYALGFSEAYYAPWTSIWGENRVSIPVDIFIDPNQQYTFTFERIAPAIPRAIPYDLSLRMVREGVAWFSPNSACSKLITVIPPTVVRQRIGVNQFISNDTTNTINTSYEAFVTEMQDPKFTIFRLSADNHQLADATVRANLANAISAADAVGKHVKIAFSIFEINPYVAFGYLQGYNPNQTLSDFLTRSYQIILGRTPSQADIDGWTTHMTSTGKTRWDIFQNFLNSAEYLANTNNIPNLHQEFNPCTNTFTTDVDEIFVIRAFSVVMGREPLCAGVTYWTSEIRETNRLNTWTLNADILRQIIGTHRNVTVGLMNEGDMFDIENGQIEKEGTQLCPIKSPIFSRDPYRVPSYLEYMRKRIAIVRQIIPSDIPLSINGVGSTHNGAHLAGCSKWRNTPSETPEEALTRLHTFFDGLGASVNNLAINFYPMTFAEVGFLETVIADLGNRYPTKNQITIDETGYSTGSCTDITCETMRRDMIQAIMDVASRIANIPAVMLYYGRQDNEYGIKSANGAPKIAYDAVPFARTISVPSQPTWCTTPILENNINVCDWYSEIEN